LIDYKKINNYFYSLTTTTTLGLTTWGNYGMRFWRTATPAKLSVFWAWVTCRNGGIYRPWRMNG